MCQQAESQLDLLNSESWRLNISTHILVDLCEVSVKMTQQVHTLDRLAK